MREVENMENIVSTVEKKVSEMLWGEAQVKRQRERGRETEDK